MAVRIRIEQPPIQPALRDPERHDFWMGFVLALIGLIVLLCGARHLTGIETTDGHSAWETQVVKAFSTGGIRLLDLTAVPPLPRPTTPPRGHEPRSRSREAGPGDWTALEGEGGHGANPPVPPE